MIMTERREEDDKDTHPRIDRASTKSRDQFFLTPKINKREREGGDKLHKGA